MPAHRRIGRMGAVDPGIGFGHRVLREPRGYHCLEFVGQRLVRGIFTPVRFAVSLVYPVMRNDIVADPVIACGDTAVELSPVLIRKSAAFKSARKVERCRDHDMQRCRLERLDEALRQPRREDKPVWGFHLLSSSANKALQTFDCAGWGISIFPPDKHCARTKIFLSLRRPKAACAPNARRPSQQSLRTELTNFSRTSLHVPHPFTAA